MSRNSSRWQSETLPRLATHVQEESVELCWRAKLATLVESVSFGSYEVPVPCGRLASRLVPGGILPPNETYWRVRTFVSSLIKPRLALIGLDGGDAPIIEIDYNYATLRWAALDYCFSPVCVVDFQERFILISNEQLDCTIFATESKRVSELERLFGGADALREVAIDWTNEFDRHFDAGRHKLANQVLLPRLYPRERP